MLNQFRCQLLVAAAISTLGWTTRASQAQTLSNPIDPADSAQADVLAVLIEDEIAEVAARSEPAPQQASPFARETIDAAALFVAGDIASYLAFTEARLVEPGVFAQESNANTFWAEGQATFVGAEFSADNIVVRPWRLGEQVFAYEANSRTSKWRSDGRAPTLAPTPECPVEQFEVLLDARLNDAATGSPFIARVGFILQHDCSQNRWTIVGLAVYNRPKGVRVAMPSF
jgi:hypothetical protein